jgi:hypothetical protein
MSFRLIRNRAQQIAVIGFIATVALSLLLAIFSVPIYITMPFAMVWMMVWLLGSASDNKESDE